MEMTTKLGTQNIKEALEFVFALAQGFEKAYSDDKKIDWLDAQYLVNSLYKMPNAIAGADQILPELKDLDEAEREDLLAFAKTEFDLTDDDLEAKIEQGLQLAVQIYAFYEKVS
jgi:hypothetical protein